MKKNEYLIFYNYKVVSYVKLITDIAAKHDVQIFTVTRFVSF